jgi:hypothetical protein
MEIPQDIIDSVIAAVGDDKRLLKQCALVSSSFLLPSRKQLFSRITLSSDEKCQGIHQFLVQNPVIQSFVRTISLTADSYWTSGEWMYSSTSLLSILLLPFCCLECFSIHGRHWGGNWDSFSSELKDALSNIIHLSTLKTLSLTSIINVPMTFFLHTVHFTTLKLDSILPNSFASENLSSLTRADLKGVAPMASQTVIDSCVWHFRDEHERRVRGTRFPSSSYFSLIQARKASTEPIFLPFLSRLRFFEIYINRDYSNTATNHEFEILSSFIDSFCTSLTSPATLEHLKLNIRFEGNDNNFDFFRFYDDLRDDVWSHLDSITTHPSGSRLQRVDISFNYAFRYDDDVGEPYVDEVVEAVLDGLPLLRTKGILFVEATVVG